MVVINPRVIAQMLAEQDATLGAMGSTPIVIQAPDGAVMQPRAAARALGASGLSQAEAEANRMATALQQQSVSLASDLGGSSLSFDGSAAVPGSLPLEVAAPVAQAAQRGGAKDPVKRLGFPQTFHDRKAAERRAAAGAPPAPADTPAENTPAAQVAEAAEKQKFDLVDAAWNRPDFGLIQDALVEHQGWTRDDAQIAARVAAGGLASVVGIPLLAAALNELNG